MGLVGYIDILAAIKANPSTKTKAQIAVGIGHTAINPLIGSMHKTGLIHISGWSMEYDWPTEAIYSYGEGQDVEPPKFRPNGRPVSGVRGPVVRRPRAEVVALASLLRCLQEPMTKSELKDATGMAETTIRAALRRLQKHRMAYVSSWVSAPGRSFALCAAYELGDSKDKPKPKARTKNEVAKRYRDARKVREESQAIGRALAANDPFRVAA